MMKVTKEEILAVAATVDASAGDLEVFESILEDCLLYIARDRENKRKEREKKQREETKAALAMYREQQGKVS